jgi:uncharacterized protein YciI
MLPTGSYHNAFAAEMEGERFSLCHQTIVGERQMRYFFLEGEHLVPFEQRDPNLIAAHRQFLQRGYDEGHFLLSGPSVPPMGGVLVARAESREQLNEFLADEPFCKANLMRFSKITEFNPVQHLPVLAEWFGAS